MIRSIWRTFSAFASKRDYDFIADKTLEKLVSDLDNLSDKVDLDGFDFDYAQGVLTVKFGKEGTFVINKQPPNQQIWLSSPRSGPKRFDYNQQTMEWVYSRDGTRLFDILDKEISQISGIDFKFNKNVQN